MVLSISGGTVGVSAATESALSAVLMATSATASPALIGVLPMGLDLDSLQFAAALNAAGAALLGASSEHSMHRTLFAESQSLAAATYAATDVANNAALAL